MITIKIDTELTPDIHKFLENEWVIADKKNIGKALDWDKKTIFFNAYQEDELVGSLELNYQEGVMCIEDLIVKNDKQGLGVGSLLMNKAEELAKKEKLHKIYLETGRTWEARRLYEKLGYVKTGLLENHFANQDYVIYTKFL